ncbi:GNAT family N-acetyltransferase [Nocardia sp. NPDC058480]|uniref:GNAT family N-acetyltransferase n=1 Tax=Nocardia sp. NPDC058480 TaxID=3346522 RepID=UPI00365B9FF2
MNGLEFAHYTADAAREGRDVVEDVYRRSYRDAIESRRAFSSPETFMQRFDAYTDPARGSGFELVVAYLNGVAVGQTWGWPLTPNTAWWVGLQLNESAEVTEFIEESGARTFALSEVMVDQSHSGRGIAHALHDELLAERTEARATLLVNPDNDRAYSAYRRWGWACVGNLTPTWPDATPTFDVLVKHLEEESL